ncbi:NADH-quinone oxidoreductase subunit D [Cutibacterium sp. WCA-380-WT-3A]|uniref:NADH-quinone oxidoreductase subunit D n=1 Tax=Cutibacterium porci TaxID=2605781 RepID=A0A7K0J4W2_9ACTN|nr:NADH-quinone oxidoreductase subunit D [Cutibacterium porci]MSS44965.1 NADH-quinone oxidoreductase subunit D [Cutibacterium porci]
MRHPHGVLSSTRKILFVVGSMPLTHHTQSPNDDTGGKYDVIRLDLGRLHPTRPGLVTIDTTVDGDLIASSQINIGNLHRGDEKLFEVRDYRQIPMLASRHDWTAPFISETGAAHVIEEAMGITVPTRVTWIRTLLVEFNRITSHLAFLSWVGHHCNDDGLENAIATAIENARRIWQKLSGNRIHPMITRIGGLQIDVDAEWRLSEWLDDVDALTPQLRSALDAAPGIHGVAVISAEMVDRYGLSGPVSLASGVDLDTRKRAAVYEELTWPDVATNPDGDAYARLAALCNDVTVSSSLCHQILDQLPSLDGPLTTRLPTALKVPRGRTWTAMEAPWGRAGYLLESRGGTTPWRMALRTPTFANVQALDAVLPGTRVADVEATIASMGWTLGDLDK